MAVPAERIPELRRQLGGGRPTSTPSAYFRHLSEVHGALREATAQKALRDVASLHEHFKQVRWGGVEPDSFRKKHDELLTDLHLFPNDNDFLRAATANYARSIASNEKILLSPAVAQQLGLMARKPVAQPKARVLRFVARA